MLIKNLFGVSNGFSLMKKHKAILNIPATLLRQPNLTLITSVCAYFTAMPIVRTLFSSATQRPAY